MASIIDEILADYGCDGATVVANVVQEGGSTVVSTAPIESSRATNDIEEAVLIDEGENEYSLIAENPVEQALEMVQQVVDDMVGAASIYSPSVVEQSPAPVPEVATESVSEEFSIDTEIQQRVNAIVPNVLAYVENEHSYRFRDAIWYTRIQTSGIIIAGVGGIGRF